MKHNYKISGHFGNIEFYGSKYQASRLLDALGYALVTHPNFNGLYLFCNGIRVNQIQKSTQNLKKRHSRKQMYKAEFSLKEMETNVNY